MSDQEYMERLERQRDEAINAIKKFCEGSNWASRDWKDQDHIKPLFDIAKKYNKEGTKP